MVVPHWVQLYLMMIVLAREVRVSCIFCFLFGAVFTAFLFLDLAMVVPHWVQLSVYSG